MCDQNAVQFERQKKKKSDFTTAYLLVVVKLQTLNRHTKLLSNERTTKEATRIFLQSTSLTF